VLIKDRFHVFAHSYRATDVDFPSFEELLCYFWLGLEKMCHINLLGLVSGESELQVLDDVFLSPGGYLLPVEIVRVFLATSIKEIPFAVADLLRVIRQSEGLLLEKSLEGCDSGARANHSYILVFIRKSER